jgi:hypothetical protein
MASVDQQSVKKDGDNTLIKSGFIAIPGGEGDISIPSPFSLYLEERR